MSHQLTAHVTFSYQGRVFNYQTTIQLEQWLQAQAQQDEYWLYHRLAQANQVDSYSYEFEVMCMQPIRFSSDSLQAFIKEGVFDYETYQQHQQQALDTELLQLIESHSPALASVEQAVLLNVLRQAYKLGYERGAAT